jgi:hypothetical protein
VSLLLYFCFGIILQMECWRLQNTKAAQVQTFNLTNIYTRCQKKKTKGLGIGIYRFLCVRNIMHGSLIIAKLPTCYTSTNYWGHVLRLVTIYSSSYLLHIPLSLRMDGLLVLIFEYFNGELRQLIRYQTQNSISLSIFL